jgi:hypothetical protein
MKKKYDDLPEIGDEPGAAFNMAIQYLKRIDTLLIECNNFSRLGSLINWYNTLLALYRELCPVMSLEETEKVRVQLGKVKKPLDVFSKGGNEFEAFNSLHEFEMELRKIMNEHDLLMPTKADPRFAVMGN